MSLGRREFVVTSLTAGFALATQPVRAEARQYALEWHRTHRTRGCAVIFGANVLVRAGVALVNAATRLLVRRDVVTEAFVASEAEAWSFEASGSNRSECVTDAFAVAAPGAATRAWIRNETVPEAAKFPTSHAPDNGA